MEEPLLRPAHVRDAVALAELGVASWEAAYRGRVPDGLLEKLSVDVRAERWLKRLSETDGLRSTWLLERSAELLGYCTVGPSRDKRADKRCVGEIQAIYVHPEHFGRGIGARLLQHGLAELWRRDFTRVTLWCLTTNLRARRFYEHAGFRLDIPEQTQLAEGFPLPHARYRLERH